MHGRVPPNDLGAEAAVISAGLLELEAFDKAAMILEPNHFYSDANRLIWEAMTTLRRGGDPIDVVTVAGWLRDRELIQRVNVRYLGEVVDMTPAVGNVAAHAELVKRKWQRRRLIAVSHRHAAEGYGDIGEDGITSNEAHDQWVAKCEKEVFAVTRLRAARHPVALGDVVASEIAIMHDQDAPDVGKILTGFRDFDEEIGGFWRGDLNLIAARPGMGKSAFATRVARNVVTASAILESTILDAFDTDRARYLIPKADTLGPFTDEAFIWSGEMPKRQVAQRFLAQEAAINTNKIRNRGRGSHAFTAAECVRLDGAKDFLRALPIRVDDTPGIDALEFCAKARQAYADAASRGRRLSLVVVDYLQKMKWPGRVNSRNEAVGEISGALKNLAMELDLPVVALCQLNRGLETRSDKRPVLPDLRESGELEQDADQVIFVYRDSYYSKKANHKEAELIVSKNRMGATGVIDVGFWSWCTRFLNLEEAA